MNFAAGVILIVVLYLLSIPVIIIAPLLLLAAHDRSKAQPKRPKPPKPPKPVKPQRTFRGPYDPKPEPIPAPSYLRRWTATRKWNEKAAKEQWENDFNHVP